MSGYGQYAVSYERSVCYRGETNRIGAALLVFSALFIGLDMLGDAVSAAAFSDADAVAQAVAGELIDSAMYFLSFLLPVLFLRAITPAGQRIPMPLSPTLPRRLGLLLPAGLTVIYCAALANDLIMRALGFPGSSPEVYLVDGVPAYEGILMLISSVLIPAFCEELLFRGAILSRLLPYGKGVAVLGSAVLFGLMHQNAHQLLYTTVGGVVLALLVIESGSVWASVLLHSFNNLFAVLEQILYRRLVPTLAGRIFGVLELALIGGGVICLTVLILQAKRRGGDGQGQALRVGVKTKRPLRDFFTPLMLAFMIISLLQMAWLLVIS